jgi:hypothetical protein
MRASRWGRLGWVIAVLASAALVIVAGLLVVQRF